MAPFACSIKWPTPRNAVATLRPVVIQTVPVSGDTKVDAAKTTEIRVTFSKMMTDKSWSWTDNQDGTALPISGAVRFDKERRTCIAPVKLEPGRTYICWLNSGRFQGFQDTDGQSGVPYLLVFETK